MTDSKTTLQRLYPWLVVALAATSLWLGFKILTSPERVLVDEPPIRVRNGSIDLEVVGGDWRSDQNCGVRRSRPCWTPSQGESQGEFGVVVESNTSCDIPSDWNIDRITVTGDGGGVVTIRPGPVGGAGGRRLKTRLQPYGRLSYDAQQKRLRDTGTRFVKTLRFEGEDSQGNPVQRDCPFADDQDLKRACFWSNGTAGTCPQ